MVRQNINLTKQNDEWLKNQILEGKFKSIGEAIDYLIKKAQNQNEYYDFIKMKIEIGEKSGLAKKQTREAMLAEFKENLPNV